MKVKMEIKKNKLYNCISEVEKYNVADRICVFLVLLIDQQDLAQVGHLRSVVFGPK